MNNTTRFDDLKDFGSLYDTGRHDRMRPRSVTTISYMGARWLQASSEVFVGWEPGSYDNSRTDAEILLSILQLVDISRSAATKFCDLLPEPVLEAWCVKYGMPSGGLPNYWVDEFRRKSCILAAVANAWLAVQYEDAKRLRQVLPLLRYSLTQAFPITAGMTAGEELVCRRAHDICPGREDVPGEGDIPPEILRRTAGAYCAALNNILKQIGPRIHLSDQGTAARLYTHAGDTFDECAYFLARVIAGNEKALRSCRSCGDLFVRKRNEVYCGKKGCSPQSKWNRDNPDFRRRQKKEVSPDGE